MRQSQLNCRTSRQAPAYIQLPGQAMLVRAGYLEHIHAGLWAYMPLLQRTIERLTRLIQDRLYAAGFLPMALPILQPTRSDGQVEMQGALPLKDDRHSIGGSSLPVLSAVICRQIQSHRDLPRYLYVIKPRFTEQARPGTGLLYAREYTILDAYSLDPGLAGQEESYKRSLEAITRLCHDIGLCYGLFESEPGLDGTPNQCLVVTAGFGDRLYIRCPGCGYASIAEDASSRLDVFPQDQQPLPRQDVLGEGLVSTEAVADFLGIPLWKTTKTMLFDADGRPVALMVRGDCGISLAKARRVLGCKRLDLLPAGQVKDLTGVDIGYLGPIGLPTQVELIADHYVGGRVNFECGANHTNYHAINVNFGRDLPLPRFEDIKLARPGHICPRCNARLEGQNGLDFAHLRRLGPVSGLEYTDGHGTKVKAYVCRYTIGISRFIGLIAEQYHDQTGLCWPVPVAPYLVHLIGLNLEDPTISQTCSQVYQRLLSERIEVLYDDRPIQAGQKFADGDLLGLPIRVTVSRRSLAAGGLEWKVRSETQCKTMTLDEAIARIKGTASAGHY